MSSEEISREALSQFLRRSAAKNLGGAWIESCSRDAEVMLGLDRHEFADLLARAAHAHHQLEAVTDRIDEGWADWYADYMLHYMMVERKPAGARRTALPAINHMKIATHELKAKHEELMEEIAAASKVDGPVGSAAREVEWVLRPHLREEEELALPALEALRALMRRAKPKELQAFVNMTDRLQREMPDIAAQHAVITLALGGLASAAELAGDEGLVKLARKLADYATTEETVIYPATVLVGDIAREQLAKGTGG